MPDGLSALEARRQRRLAPPRHTAPPSAPRADPEPGPAASERPGDGHGAVLTPTRDRAERGPQPARHHTEAVRRQLPAPGTALDLGVEPATVRLVAYVTPELAAWLDGLTVDARRRGRRLSTSQVVRSALDAYHRQLVGQGPS